MYCSTKRRWFIQKKIRVLSKKTFVDPHGEGPFKFFIDVLLTTNWWWMNFIYFGDWWFSEKVIKCKATFPIYGHSKIFLSSKIEDWLCESKVSYCLRKGWNWFNITPIDYGLNLSVHVDTYLYIILNTANII
jgi:hypothetical protein